MCLSAAEVQLMDGGKIEFAELAFWKFNFYLGQQVALLCADKTTAWQLELEFMKFEVKINPQDFRKWIFTSVTSISIFNFHKNWMATIYTHRGTPSNSNCCIPLGVWLFYTLVLGIARHQCDRPHPREGYNCHITCCLGNGFISWHD